MLIFVPAIGAVAVLLPRNNPAAVKMIALGTAIVCLLLNIAIAFDYYGTTGSYGIGSGSVIKYMTDLVWIDSVNIHYITGVDGLNLPLLLLTSILNVIIIAASWNIEKQIKGFLCLYLLLMFGMYGVFLSLDFFLFYVFFEVSLLPMYFLIGIWGGPRKEYAAIKFFLYTLVGSICLLIVMLGFYFLIPKISGAEQAVANGKASFNMIALAEDGGFQRAFGQGGVYWTHAKWFFMLLFVSFAIKVPAVPFHTWLPDAHVEAPTPISMILAGVLLKMGGYALMRINYAIFPDAAMWAWFIVAMFGLVAIIYGAFCAMAQTDWKKLVAYSSVSHMGYVILGLAVLTTAGRNGAYFQMIGHGISSAMMFYLVGVVYERAHHRELGRFGGLWNTMPAYTGLAAVGFFAGLGLPLLCGFPGEALSLLGTFKASDWLTTAPEWVPFAGAGAEALVITIGIIAATGVVLTAGYVLWMFQRVYMGPAKPEYSYSGRESVQPREYFVMAVLAVFAILLGVFPSIVFSLTDATFGAAYAGLGDLVSNLASLVGAN
ncbi:MAG: NADH-quinone oxidoreductase subunit M [Planctomycetes bacterium]|nr:NADH-quinone oxidoreductase subunit M [Planctomycetota bacterium]NOG54297.1 NADH-quinone oxidoreductase subunit M [Planctomycetota bacterium]